MMLLPLCIKEHLVYMLSSNPVHMIDQEEANKIRTQNKWPRLLPWVPNYCQRVKGELLPFTG